MLHPNSQQQNSRKQKKIMPSLQKLLKKTILRNTPYYLTIIQKKNHFFHF